MTTEVMRVRSRGVGVIKRLIEITLFIAAGALLSRIQLLDMLYPFGPAFVAACFLKKRDMPLFAAAGAARTGNGLYINGDASYMRRNVFYRKRNKMDDDARGGGFVYGRGDRL